MQPRLVVFLPETDDRPLLWVSTDEQGIPDGSGELTGELPSWAADRPVTALADGRAVLVTRITVPTRNRERLRRALPFALEDQLTDDVEALHFAPGHIDSEGEIAVAVVAHERMQRWLARLDELGIEPEAMYPDMLALPYEDGTWTVAQDDEAFTVRTAFEQGFAGDAGNMAPLLFAALTSGDSPQPQSITLYQTPNQPVPSLGEDAPPLQHGSLTSRLTLGAGGLAQARLSLLVGDYQRQRSTFTRWRRWLPAACLGAALLVTVTARAWLENYQLQQRITASEQALTQRFKEAFPDSNIAPGQMRRVMENRLERLDSQNDDGSGGFLVMLNRIAPEMDGKGSIEPRAISYRQGRLELELFADSLQHIDNIKKAIDARDGLSAEVRSTNTEGDKVRARLVIDEVSQ